MSNARNDKNFKRKRGQHPSFQKGVSYWDSIDATVDGVLGGYGNGSLPRVDALGSRMFLLSLKPSLSTIVASHRQSLPERLRQYNALDCGAGIGRVTDSVLLHLFDRVDLVESSSHFLDAAIQASSGWRGISDASKGVRFFKAGLQTFNPVSPPMQYSAAKGAQDFEAGYDVVWIQWVAGHLGSQELVDFLKQCAKALKHPAVPCEKSLIVLKENVLLGVFSIPLLCIQRAYAIGRNDTSFRKAFSEAGLTLLREEVQHGLPTGLYPVKMYALYSDQV